MEISQNVEINVFTAMLVSATEKWQKKKQEKSIKLDNNVSPSEAAKLFKEIKECVK